MALGTSYIASSPAPASSWANDEGPGGSNGSRPLAPSPTYSAGAPGSPGGGYGSGAPGSGNPLVANPITPTQTLSAQYAQWVKSQLTGLSATTNAKLLQAAAQSSGQFNAATGDYQNQYNNFGYSLGQNQVNQNLNSLDQQSAADQLGFVNQNYANDIGYNAQQQQGILDQYNSDLGYNGQQQGFLSTGLGLDQTAAGYTRDQAKRAAMSDATTRGDVGGAGANQALADIQNQYNLTSSKNQLGYDQSSAGLQNNATDLGLQETGALQGLAHDQSSQTIQHNSDVSSAQTNLAKLGQQDQGLKLVASQIGMNQADATRVYKQQIAALGLDYSQVNQQIQDWYNSGNQQLQQQAASFQAQLLQAAALQG